MLQARGETRLGLASLRWALGFTEGLWAIAIARSGLIMDTRLIPPSEAPSQPRACVQLVLRGRWDIHAPLVTRLTGPAAFVLSEAQLDGSRGKRPFTYSATGQSYASVELHLPTVDLLVGPSTMPTPLYLDEATWTAAWALAEIASLDDARFRERLVALLERLTAASVVRAGVALRASARPSAATALLWSALRPMIERLYLAPTLQEVVGASGMAARTLDRHTRSLVASFGLAGARWRPATRHLRLRLAVVLLSAEGAAVADVAAAVGYGSSDALSRAFRDANMPPPGVVQRQVATARAASSD